MRQMAVNTNLLNALIRLEALAAPHWTGPNGECPGLTQGEAAILDARKAIKEAQEAGGHGAHDLARQACQALADAYTAGQARGGSVEWSDIDAAHALACRVLGLPGGEKYAGGGRDEDSEMPALKADPALPMEPPAEGRVVERVLVAGIDPSGEASLLPLTLLLTEDQYALGDHLLVARDRAEEAEWEGPFVVFSSDEIPNIWRAVSWESGSDRQDHLAWMKELGLTFRDCEIAFGEEEKNVSPRDPWQDDPVYSREDWRYEVANNDTVCGYLEWVKHCRERDAGCQHGECIGGAHRHPVARPRLAIFLDKGVISVVTDNAIEYPWLKALELAYVCHDVDDPDPEECLVDVPRRQGSKSARVAFLPVLESATCLDVVFDAKRRK
jgi:hypothetical protein